MVVGLATYQDKKEAYPLDKKILNKVALRSFLAGASYNLETANSLGWLWAIQPALDQIHTTPEDKALAYGHHLESASAHSSLSPFAMGVVLALEQRKSDLEVIRGARSVSTFGLDALGYTLTNLALAPILYYAFSKAGDISLGIVVAYAVIFLLLHIILRMVSIRYGYRYGIRAVEASRKHSDRLKKSVATAGITILGGLIVLLGYNNISLTQTLAINTHFSIVQVLFCVFSTWLCFNLLTKKNASLGKCFFILMVLGVLLGVALYFLSV